MSAFDVVVFDYDGTLFDTRSAIAHCIRRAFDERALPIPSRDRVMTIVKTGLPLPETLIALHDVLRGDRGALDALIRTYRRLYLDEGTPLLKPFPGVTDALRQLHAGGAKCLVVSNKGIAAIRRSLDESRLASWVDLVFGDEPGLPKKPDPAILTDHILPRYAQLRRERILIVGDTEIDILFAKSTGAISCWASYGYGEPERCRRLAPEHEISNIEELPALVHRG
jgi:phosphoglycolate phosphatase